MVSASTLVTSPHTRSIFSKPVRRRSRTWWIIQAINGRGSRVTSANQGLMEARITAVITSISTSLRKSSACSDRNTQMRSDSLPMRAIRSPVRLPPKYSRLSVIRWEKVLVRKSAPMRSDTRASK